MSGCAAEVSQRIAEAVFDALVQAIPNDLFAAPAGTSGNLAIGGNDPARDRSYVMYRITSYNVCYTKLLRWMRSFSPHQDRAQADLAQSTD